MPTYIVLGQFTDQGIRNVKETTKRAQALKDMAKKFGATVNAVDLMLGQDDIATIVDAPDDTSVNALLLSVGALGNVRTQTLRAFSADEIGQILGQDGVNRAADGNSSTLVTCRHCRLPSAHLLRCGLTCVQRRRAERAFVERAHPALRFRLPRQRAQDARFVFRGDGTGRKVTSDREAGRGALTTAPPELRVLSYVPETKDLTVTDGWGGPVGLLRQGARWSRQAVR